MNNNTGLVAVTKTSKKGTSLRITLPREVSEALSVGEGQFVGFYAEGGKIILKKIE
jgi:bifunctional DNA-binding transcriptional regulator/antitoxin component of YhaV-PrlF toxin-antitoxin module